MESKFDDQLIYIKEFFQDKFINYLTVNDSLIIYIDRLEVVSFLYFLKHNKNLSFEILLDVFGIDFLGVKNIRFEVVYNLLSLKHNKRITVKVALSDKSSIHSLSKIFSSAGWFEREVFDMYGIVFDGHNDLRRILTDYGFDGHPLRKDFPLTGYKEVRYNQDQKRVVYESVNLTQEFRNFDFESPWVVSPPNLPGDEKFNQ